MVKILSSGSNGNAVLYSGSILVDCGVPFSAIKPYMYNIQLVVLTHEHTDHINLATLAKLASERPGLRIVCGDHLRRFVHGYKNVDFVQINTWYDYTYFKIMPVQLYHDVPNFGYRIFVSNGIGGYYKIFHATDTAHLDGIDAKNYDLYCIEHNWNEDTVFDSIRAKELRGEYAYERGAINTHMSEQKARKWLYENKSEVSKVVRLHESKHA